MIEDSLNPPYYAVIFSSQLVNNSDEYLVEAEKMEKLAQKHEGYLGIEAARKDIGITVSYWKNLEAIVAWKNNLEHVKAREKGRELWYQKYQIRICKVEREYGFERM